MRLDAGYVSRSSLLIEPRPADTEQPGSFARSKKGLVAVAFALYIVVHLLLCNLGDVCPIAGTTQDHEAGGPSEA
jgi:hypothetical protein